MIEDKPLTAEACDAALAAFLEVWELVPQKPPEVRGLHLDRMVRVKRFIERARRLVAELADNEGEGEGEDGGSSASEGADSEEGELALDEKTQAIFDAVVVLARPLEPADRLELYDTMGDEFCSECGEDNEEGHACANDAAPPSGPENK
jgi:hypothetical protein